jgi:IS1 family transposase
MFPRHTHLLQAFSCRTLRQLILKLSPDSFKCFHCFTDLVLTYKRLDEFIEICSTIRLQNFSEDALRLRLFSFSLKEKAKYWLTSLELHYFLGSDATRVP